MSNRGCFITVEGTEGVGKTTNMDYTLELLQKAGIEVVTTREPGGTEIGEEIRSLLLGHKHDGMHDDTELMLMFAARAEHIAQVIRPALEQGKWVMCDRFTDATYAYQGGGRGIDMQRIAALENWVQGELRPDLTLLLDVPVEIGLERAGKRSAPDRFEKEKHDFFEKVRAMYLQRAREEAERFRIIDASQALDDVRKQLQQVLTEFLSTQGYTA